MRFEAVYCGILTVVPDYPEEIFDHDEVIEAAVDRMSDELEKFVKDPIVSGSYSTGEIRVIAYIEADDPVKGFQDIDSAVRSAFHAAEVQKSS